MTKAARYDEMFDNSLMVFSTIVSLGLAIAFLLYAWQGLICVPGCPGGSH